MTKWEPWHSGDYAPVARGVLIEYERRDGHRYRTDDASELRWRHEGAVFDIMRYRIITNKATDKVASSFLEGK